MFLIEKNQGYKIYEDKMGEFYLGWMTQDKMGE